MSEELSEIEQSLVETEFSNQMPEQEGLLKKIARGTGKGALAVGFVLGLVTTGADYSSLETATEYAVYASPWACILYAGVSLIYSEKK